MDIGSSAIVALNAVLPPDEAYPTPDGGLFRMAAGVIFCRRRPPGGR
jgi:hypothetical protein